MKLFISTPCYDAMMTMQYTISLLNLTNLLNREKIQFVIDFIGNESLIPRARNNSLGKFMESDFTHLLFIDSDIEFPAQAVLDLLNFDKDVVCCAYPKKDYNWNRFMASMQKETTSKESSDSRGLDFSYNAIYDNDKNLIKKGDFLKVRHASTGFMMIKREILESLANKPNALNLRTDSLYTTERELCGLFCCMIQDKQYLSEDFSFCERVNNIEGDVWINIHHNLNHIGKYSFKSDIKNRVYHGRRQDERGLY